MTRVEAHYAFTAPFEEGWTRSIEALHGVYGIQAIKLDPKLDGLTVLYDATRMSPNDVERHLRGSGMPVEQTGLD